MRNYLHWSEPYRVGIALLDEQHYKLIDIANELYHGVLASRYMLSTDAESEEFFRNGMRAAVQYVKVHFATEEDLMQKYNYPNYAAHKLEHEDYARSVLECVHNYELGYKLAGLDFVRYLRAWLLHHVAMVDKELVIHIKKCEE